MTKRYIVTMEVIDNKVPLIVISGTGKNMTEAVNRLLDKVNRGKDKLIRDNDRC
ncbi:MAG: hypothetical protein ACREBJ_05875 [Nitrosotalea sp.]